MAGCTDTNTGFDGLSYQPLWPDGNTRLHPEPFLFSSPLTGDRFDVNYKRIGFEADLPRIEASDLGGPCSRVTGAGCTLIPVTDDGQPASFYPYFSAVRPSGGGDSERDSSCMLGFGSTLPRTINDFGKNNGYGSLLFSVYLRNGAGGATRVITNNFRQVFPNNPCPARGGDS